MAYTVDAPLRFVTSACRLACAWFPRGILQADAVRAAVPISSAGYSLIQLASSLAIYSTGIAVLSAVVDTAICRPLTRRLLPATTPSSTVKKTAWFLLHSVFNSVIVAVSLRDGALAAAFPVTRGYEPAHFWGTSPAGLFGAIAIGGFHLHHALAYRDQLTKEDVVHHMVNAGGVVVIGALCPWGRFTALSNLAMCGVPGAINYFVLWLQRCVPGSVGRRTQKNINRFCNMVLRYPVQLLSVYGLCVAFASGQRPKMNALTVACVVLGASLHTLNALYYADQVVGNYHVDIASSAAEAKTATAGRQV